MQEQTGEWREGRWRHRGTTGREKTKEEKKCDGGEECFHGWGRHTNKWDSGKERDLSRNPKLYYLYDSLYSFFPPSLSLVCVFFFLASFMSTLFHNYYYYCCCRMSLYHHSYLVQYHTLYYHNYHYYYYHHHGIIPLIYFSFHPSPPFTSHQLSLSVVFSPPSPFPSLCLSVPYFYPFSLPLLRSPSS